MKHQQLNKRALLTGLCLGLAATVQAATLLTFSVDMSVQVAGATFVDGTDTVVVRGTFDGWSGGGLPLVQVGATSVYTNSATTTEANGSVTKYYFKKTSAPVVDETVASFNNRAAYLPAGGGSLVLPTPFFGDSGVASVDNVTFKVDVSQAIALGTFIVGTSTVDIRGNQNGWSSGSILSADPSIARTNQFGLITSNVYVGTFSVTRSTNASMDFKYVIEPGTYWESVTGANADSGGNRFFTHNAAQTLPVVDYNDAPFAPIAQLTFQVDMAAVDSVDPAFVHGPTTVYMAGAFNGWNTSATPMTNDPSAVNTNIYKCVIPGGAGSTVTYKFTYQNGNTVWEEPIDTGGANRNFNVPNSPTVLVPSVNFGDIGTNDLLQVPTTVIYRVSMTNAVQYPSSTPFNAGSDTVHVNGANPGSVWVPFNILDLAPYTMANEPVGSLVYTFTNTFPAGVSRYLNYKYSINGGDNEAANFTARNRFIRGNSGTYVLPLDHFGNIVDEVRSGDLKIGPASGGSAPITWLGYPSVRLQSRPALNSGSWTDEPATAGLDSTNWPTSGNQFFRLVGP